LIEDDMKIGIVLLTVEQKELKRAHSYQEVREMALRAEQLGFDSIWLYDHLLYRPDKPPITIGIWECWTILSALAEATQRVELGTVVICNPSATRPSWRRWRTRWTRSVGQVYPGPRRLESG
jgi:hypothetical protein